MFVSFVYMINQGIIQIDGFDILPRQATIKFVSSTVLRTGKVRAVPYMYSIVVCAVTKLCRT